MCALLSGVQLVFRPPVQRPAKRKREQHETQLEELARPGKGIRSHDEGCSAASGGASAGEHDRSDWCDLHQVDHQLMMYVGQDTSDAQRRGARRWLSFNDLPSELQIEIFLRLPLAEVRISAPGRREEAYQRRVRWGTFACVRAGDGNSRPSVSAVAGAGLR